MKYLIQLNQKVDGVINFRADIIRFENNFIVFVSEYRINYMISYNNILGIMYMENGEDMP